ncbi:MAG: hypothetical protein DI539_29870 [Flavobacterium psychrophilum]|jgi:hypothetical protein|nr:MAG: hypothetical protein DI539_29870 [Flavobacterium psychrophilum]
MYATRWLKAGVVQQDGCYVRQGDGYTLVFGFVWTASWVWSARKDLNEAKKIIEQSKVTDKLIPYVKTDAGGSYFIEFMVTRQGNKEVMKVAKIDKNTIRVYLGKDSISAK